MSRIGALAALTLVTLGGCTGPEAFTARNLVLVSFDALGADELGCYGNPGARTPGCDRLARQGGQFRTMLAASPVGRVSRVTMLSGAQPHEHGRRRATDQGFAASEPTLAQLCSGGSLAAAAFGGFETPNDPALVGFETTYAAQGQDLETPLTGGIARWLGELPPERPFLVYVCGTTRADVEGSPASMRASRVTRADHALLDFVRSLEDDDRLTRTFLIITADRGIVTADDPRQDPESPRSGALTPEASLTDAALRVPLVLWGPFPFRGGIVRSDLARSMDILPTALEALRIGTRATRPGRSLQIRLKPYRAAALAASAEIVDPDGHAVARTIRTPKWRYTHGASKHLFDVIADPAERTDVSLQHPEEADALRRRLDKVGPAAR